MADISITAANVIPSAKANLVHGRIANAAITAGQPVYLDANGKVNPAGASLSSPGYNVVGIAVNSAAAGQPVSYATSDPAFTLGGTVGAGAVVILSTNAGNIAPVADMASGEFPSVLGIGIGSNQINLSITPAGVAAAA